MHRYLERAENTARLIEAGWHIALTQHSGDGNEWQSLITTAGVNEAYDAKHTDYDAKSVINFMLRDPDNPSSVMTSITAARTNARLVRTALSSEVWEATNECWMLLKDTLAKPVTDRTLHQTLSDIRYHTSVVRGALHGTMLRNDIFAFAHLGTFIERADNTARILDVKYYVLLPSAAMVGTRFDNAQWEVLLRSLSAARSYRWLYSGKSNPLNIADFLILDERMPRSLSFCYKHIAGSLASLEQEYDITTAPSASGKVGAYLKGQRISDIFEGGLHEFLQDNIRYIGDLAQQIETDFRFYA